MPAKTRTTVYIDSDLYILAKGMGINFSELCNHALAGVVGVKYGSDKELIRMKTQEMVEMVKNRFEDETNRFEEEYRKEQEKKIRKEIDHEIRHKKEDILKEVFSEFYHPSYKNRLPENDYHGDYVKWWADFSGQLSGRAGFTISSGEAQDLVRGY